MVHYRVVPWVLCLLLAGVENASLAHASELVGASKSTVLDTAVTGTAVVVGGVGGCVLAAGATEKALIKGMRLSYQTLAARALMVGSCSTGASAGASLLGAAGASANEVPSEVEMGAELEATPPDTSSSAE